MSGDSDMTTRFVVLSTQRSGSTWVVDMLDSHPRIVAYSELLNDAGRGRPQWGGAKDMLFWTSWREQRVGAAAGATTQAGAREAADGAPLLPAYLDEVFRPRPGIDAVGLKVMYDQLAAKPALYRYMREHGVRVVHLQRANLLHVLVSRYVAMASDVFHTRDAPSARAQPVRLDAQTLLAQLRAMRRDTESVQAALTQRGIQTHEVHYEQLVDDRGRFDALTRFLGVHAPGAPLASGLRKIVRRPISEMIENHAEVRAALAGTEFEAMAAAP